MEIHNLVKMANQIGRYFESFPDGEQGAEEVCSHVRRFWDPRMRQALIENLDTATAAGLSPFVAVALRRL